eukprot:CAMPEP_0179877930 /NCGR_PEP_ID=MMETSP0982-20121206/25045_1 /TAXON_ID=483367 /ORGANISM="non described non described, Strain CCMP 2436" /LENGTH=89 /DNA_ID=CAMNT_0021770547 /DNA_START=338 /DNA_END=604 /DNA_ORIENTATION=+
MTSIAAAALALGVGVEHVRPGLPASIFTPVDARAQRWRAAMVGGGVLCVAAYMYPGRVAPFSALVQRATGMYSPMLAAAGLGALYYAGA